MVNYCCVYGCGRNSRSNQNLYYYSVPKATFRQEQWLKAAGRPELLDKAPDKRVLYRICSRHFAPSSFKNKHLCADAVPSLYLPGSESNDGDTISEEDKQIHQNIACDNCGNTVSGFRYKCMTCSNYDLCSRCEINEAHSQHYMLRIPTPNKSKRIENLVKKWQELYNTSYLKTDDSSDDEPITKYITKRESGTNYDSGVDLTEEVKESIRNEVHRVLTQKPDKRKKKSVKRAAETDNSRLDKRLHIDIMDETTYFGNTTEFADCTVQSVDGSQILEVKTEPNVLPLQPITAEPCIPMMQMKLSDDLSELIFS